MEWVMSRKTTLLCSMEKKKLVTLNLNSKVKEREMI